MSAFENRFASLLSHTWWLVLLRGIAAIVFGVLTWMQPGLSLAVLVLLYGAFALVDGIFTTWGAISGRKENNHWWLPLLEGLLGIVVGGLTFVVPGITALALLFYIALRALVGGVLQIEAAIQLRKEMEGEWVLVLAGILSIVFGVILISQPGAGALAVLWIIATYAVLFGILMVMLAFKVRSYAKRLGSPKAA